MFNDLPPEARSAIIGTIVGAASGVLTAFLTSVAGIVAEGRKSRYETQEDHRQKRAAVFADVLNIAEDWYFKIDNHEQLWGKERDPDLMGPFQRALALAQLYGGRDTAQAASDLRAAARKLAEFAPADTEEKFKAALQHFTEMARAEIAPQRSRKRSGRILDAFWTHRQR